MSKLSKVVVAALAIILGIADSTSAQTKKQRKKSEDVQGTLAIEDPADPKDTFYKMTVGLPTVDKVELFSLTARRKGQPPKTQPDTMGKEEFPFGGTVGNQYQITSQNILSGEAAENFAAQWRKLMRGPGAGCFMPAYSIRFWAKDQILLETEVCYHCHNVRITENGRSEIRGFNAEGKSGKDLLERLKKLLPESDTGRNHQ